MTNSLSKQSESNNSQNNSLRNHHAEQENFSLGKMGSTVSIIFLLIIIAVLSYYLWSCKNTVKAALKSAASDTSA